MASVSRCYMPSACNSWMEQAFLEQWDSTFQIAVEQQPSASAMVEAQLANSSLRGLGSLDGRGAKNICLLNGLGSL